MSKIIPITKQFDSVDFKLPPKDLDLGKDDIFTGVLSIACRVGILSNPTIPPIDIDIDVDSQDDHGLSSEVAFEDGDGNWHTLAVIMTSSTLSVMVTNDKGEIENNIDVEVKIRVEADSAVPPSPKKEEKEVDAPPWEQDIKPELPTQDRKDLRDYAVKESDGVSRIIDPGNTIYVLGQDDLIYIVGLDEELDHEACASKLLGQWRKESLNNLDKEDRQLIQDDMVTLLPLEVAVDIQDHLIDILERTYGIPILMAVSRGHTYYLPLVDRDGKPHDPSLIACLDWDLWCTSKNVLANQLTDIIHDENVQVLTMKQALIKQRHLKK